jgi:hypothetical protein
VAKVATDRTLAPLALTMGERFFVALPDFGRRDAVLTTPQWMAWVRPVAIRFGWCADLNEWYVTWSGGPTTQWMFKRREDAERAIVEMKATYDGEWDGRQAPGGQSRP